MIAKEKVRLNGDFMNFSHIAANGQKITGKNWRKETGNHDKSANVCYPF